jgi:hypothetical protein
MNVRKLNLTICTFLLLAGSAFAQGDLRKARNEVRNAKNGVKDVKQITKDVKEISNEMKGDKNKGGDTDEPVKSSAKTYYKLFWKHVEQGQVSMAESDLKNLKKIEPEYNTSEMEKALAEAKDQQASQKDAKEQEKEQLETKKEEAYNAKKAEQDAQEAAKGRTRNTATGYSSLLTDLFSVSSVTLNVGPGEVAHKTKYLEEYRTKIKEMESAPTNPGDKMFEATVDNYERGVVSKYETEIERKSYQALAEDIKKAGSEENAKALYTKLLLHQAYWEAASRCPAFKRKADFAKVYQDITATIQKVGSIDNAVQLAKKGEADRIKTVKMPAALTTNAAMEAEFRKAFEGAGWGETILKINLLDTDWHIERNELTGVILSRYQTAAIAAKQNTGRCMLYTFSIKQEYNGSGYGSSRRDSHGSNEISCENVK